jgi:long-chain acyl-CoA synthetase
MGNGMLTLGSVLSRTSLLFGERPAVLDTEAQYSWRQFVNRIARAADVLRSLGISPGQRFAILCHNSFRQAELMQAGYWLGAVPVPVNYRLAPPEIAYILDNAECSLLLVEHVFAQLLQAEELAPWANNRLCLGGQENQLPGPRYDELLRTAKPVSRYDAREDEDAVIIYTGGTTGRPKGVRLSHRNIVINAMQLGLVVRPRQDDVYLHVAPMFHSADFLANPFVLAGAAHVFLPRFSGRAVLQAIQQFRVTCTLLTPTMIILALQEKDFHSYDLSSLRQIMYGSSPMAVEWIHKAMQRFRGVEFIQSYGLTETAPILTTLGMAEHEQASSGGSNELLSSVGRPLVGVELKIEDEQGRQVATGMPGEVVVRAPNVAKGYLKRPQATAEAFRDNWFYSGDIGRMDERGYLYLLDRKKDMIITGGELVFSLEVESVLYQHPGVRECAVVGVPDETYGEALLAAVVPAQDISLTDDELIAFCRGRIGGYKIPRRYVFLDELPKSAMNKVLKTELRQRYGGGRAAGEE